MAVHLTRIYTKTGDDGTTALGDFSRVRKTDVRLAAYADTDEGNAAIGVAVTVGGLPDAVLAPLRQVQNDLFDVGADLCTPITPDPEYPPLRVTEDYVTRLEGWCDEFNAGLPKLDSFILPGGTPGAAYLHVARTVTRRAERSVWALLEADAERTNPLTATLPQPAVGPAVHPRPGGQPRRRRALAARRPVPGRSSSTAQAHAAVARAHPRRLRSAAPGSAEPSSVGDLAVACAARRGRTPARTGSR